MKETATASADSIELSRATEPELSVVDRLSESFQSIKQGQIAEGATDFVGETIVPALGGLLALLAAYFLAKLVSRQFRRMVCARVDETLGKFVGKLVFYGILILSFTIILPIVGIQISGLMAILAAAGFAIGLAFQGTLSNFSAGVMLLVFRPFKVGDVVSLAGTIGKVDEIDIFTTTLDTPDNRRLIIPNSSIAGNTIENITFHEHRRVDVTVGVEYSASLERTREALVCCAESMAQWTIQGEGRGYQVILANLADSSVQWTVRVWVARDNFFECKERLTTELKKALSRDQIGIAYPQLRVHWAQTPTTSDISSTATRNTPQASLSMPNIHPPEDRKARIRPRARSEGVE